MTHLPEDSTHEESRAVRARCGCTMNHESLQLALQVGQGVTASPDLGVLSHTRRLERVLYGLFPPRRSAI